MSATFGLLDLVNPKADVGAHQVEEIFTTAASPGVIATFLPNEYYATEEAYLYALAEVMQEGVPGHCAGGYTVFPERRIEMTRVGTGKYTYELIQDFPKLPAGESFGIVSTVATDSQDRLYVFQRTNPPVVVFDREGNYLNAWGIGAITDPHGMTIVDDIVYITDRSDSVAVTFTLDGKPLQVIGKRGVHSDTGCEKPGDLVPRAAGPFNYPTEMVPSPSGDLYISDGYRNSRVHRFTRDGQLINSWGQPGRTAPGQFHLPHSVLVAPDGKVYVCDRTNRRVQIFSAEGEFISMWTGMGGPNDIARDNDGVFYICEQEADGAPPFVSIRDGNGSVLARWEVRHAHGLWVDSRGDIYLGLTTNHSVDKYVRVA